VRAQTAARQAGSFCNTAAMQLEVSAQHEAFLAVPLAVIQPGTLAPVDIYIRVKKPAEYVLYKRARAPFYERTRQRLLDRDVHALYLRKADQQAYNEYVEENLSRIIRDDLLPVRQSCEIVYETSSRVMTEVFEDPRSGRSMARARRMVEATVLSILKRPDSLWHMRALASHHYRTYTHCVHACMFLVATGKALLGIKDQLSLNRVGFGGILHDIGKSQIPDAILSKPRGLTPAELDLIKQHPLMGLEIARGVKRLPAVAAEVIRSHHERLDGTGYPAGLSGDQISPVVRLSSIIDVYDALTTDRAYAQARSSYSALKMMLTDMEGQFDTKLLESFIKFLGPG